jgi:hypothetical protein
MISTLQLVILKEFNSFFLMINYIYIVTVSIILDFYTFNKNLIFGILYKTHEITV